MSLQQVFDLILTELGKVVPYDSCSVQQIEDDEMVIVGGHGFPNLDELLGQRFFWDRQDDPARQVVQRREPFIIGNVSAHFAHFEDDAHGAGRVKGWMGVPLLFGDRLIGMLTLDKMEADFYTAEHANMARAFATYVATAIEKPRLFNEIQKLFEETKGASYETYAHVKDVICCEEYEKIEVKGFAYPVSIYRSIDLFANLNDAIQPIHAKRPHFQLDVDLSPMSADERKDATALLRQALSRLTGEAET